MCKIDFAGYVVFILMLIIGGSTQKQCRYLNKIESAGNAMFNIIGFFPVINEYPSELYVNSLLKVEVMRYVIAMFNKKYSRNLIGYTIYDTCSPDEYAVTTKAFMSLMLSDPNEELINNRSFHHKSCPCVYKKKPLNNILGVVGPSLSSKTAHINKLLSYQRLPMVSYGSTSPELSDNEKYPYLFRTIPPDLLQAHFLEEFLVASNWTYISVLNSDDTYGRGGTHTLSKSMLLCIYLQKTVTFPIQDVFIQPVMKRLKESVDSNVVVLWGHFNLVQSILIKAASYGVHNKTWIISEASARNVWFVSGDNKLDGNIILIVPNGGRYEKFENYFFNITYSKSRGNPWLQTFFQNQGVNSSHNSAKSLREFKSLFEVKNAGFTRNAVVTYLNAFSQYVDKNGDCDLRNMTCNLPLINNYKNFSELFIQPLHFKGLFNETISFDRNGDIDTGIFELYVPAKGQKELFTLLGSWSPETGLSLKKNFIRVKSHCTDNCSAGFYPIFSKLKKCCWKCVECIEDYVKPDNGLHMCEKCPHFHGSNKEKTKCIQFSLVYLDYNTLQGYIIYFVSSVGIVITLVTISTFIVGRNTQVVRSSNIFPSMVQILAHLFLFILPYLFLDEDTETKCTTRIFGFGLLFSLIVGITFAKVTYISSLFKLKHRISKREKFQLTTKMFITVIISVLIEVCLMAVLMQIQPMKITHNHDITIYEVYYYCHIGFHLRGQLAYILCLQVICCTQAFLARNLPDVYNETKYIAFAMFTSIVVFALSIPLIESYEKPKDKMFVLSIAIMVANLLMFVILYVYKVILIWIYVKKNGLPGSKRSELKLRQRVSNVTRVTLRNNML